MPTRINKAIELLEQSQPIYYVGVSDVSYEIGRKMAGTWADYINVSMEHGAFDVPGLGAFMQGLVDGGPTASGHRTPAVIVDLPVEGIDEATVRANAWMFKQVLARGVHGILLCHAEDPVGVQTFVEACRYPFQTLGVGECLRDGRRGAGGQGSAAGIWGLSVQEYLDKADPWPLNPGGELLLGVKIENKRALANAEATTEVSGLAFGEWGPGDMGMSLGYPGAHDAPYPENMIDARDRVMAACKAAGLHFLNGVNTENVAEMIEKGVMICSSRTGEEAAKVGRAHTGREMAV
jgi:4-hydroxy-2-oxoheptanedioate aldolase